MARVEIELSMPGGTLPTDADPAGFKSTLTDGLRALVKSYASLKVDKPSEGSAPPDTTGAPEAIRWVLNHHEELHTSLLLLKDLIMVGSAAAMAYMRFPSKPLSAKKPALAPVLTMKAAQAEIRLPADEKTTAQFLTQIEKKLQKS